jgi:N-sulfoglucosamine sulfohydrolase
MDYLDNMDWLGGKESMTMKQDRRRFLKTGALGALGAAALGATVRETPKNRLNVLFITTDDLGPVLSCYGETLIETPHTDKLAASGVRFSVAYVAQASCSPSRSSMFTGLHTHSTGQYGLTNTGFSLHPELRDKTIPNQLKRAGYHTGIIGKLHVAPEDSFQFDVWPKGNTRDVRWVANAADEFLAETGDQPFFLMVNYSDPHAFRDPEDRRKWSFPPQVKGLPVDPLPPGPETIFDFQQIDTPEQRIRTAGYYNAVQRVDTGVGMLMDVLEKRGHDGDTLVIFIGDHGPPFARGKTTTYEAALRIPFIVRWPGVSKPMASEAMVSTIDILPTILEATGLEPAGKMHGQSLRPVLQDADASWRPYLVGEFHCHGARPFYPRRAIRDKRYKLIHNLLAGEAKPSTGIDGDPAYRVSQEPKYDGTAVRRAFDTFANPPEFELYDLEKDPIEFDNLAGKPEMREVEERMKKALLDYRKRTDDPFLDRAFLEKIRKQALSR